MVKPPKASLEAAAKAASRRRFLRDGGKEHKKMNAGAQEAQAKINLCRFDLQVEFLRLLSPAHQVLGEMPGQVGGLESRGKGRTLH